MSPGRRTLVVGLVAGAVGITVGCNDTDRAATPPKGSRRIRYGDQHPAQHGDLSLPGSTPKGLVVLVHGGFWYAQYGADLMEPLAQDLNARGYATWNLEYRRIDDGGGYPATFEDVAAGIDRTATLGVPGTMTVLGHSAGGHLAVWAASRGARTPGGKPRVLAETTISLSGVLDLRAAARQQLGGGAAEQLMGGTPQRLAEDYTWADPTQLVPAHGSVRAVHASSDRNVPLSQSTAYVDADLAAGGAAGLVTVPGDHFDLIDPSSAAWAKVITLLED